MRVREIQSGNEWNRLVRTLPSHDMYQGFEWGEVRSSQGWCPRRLAVLDGDECVAASAILVKPLPLTGRKAGYSPGGPLLRDASDPAAWAAWLSSVGDLARAERLAFLRTDRGVPADEEDSVAPALRDHGFEPLEEDWTTWNVPRIVMRMSVLEPEEVLLRALRRRFREYIASAPRRGLTVRPAASLAEGLRFREALATVGQRRGQPVRNRAYFERLWRGYVEPGHGVLLLAEHEGRTVGGLLGTRFGSKAHMLYAVFREVVGNLRLHQAPLLYWEFIRWARRAGCASVDWGGIATRFPPRQDDVGYGLYQFKLGFNAQPEHLTAYHDLVFSPRVYGGFRFLERRVAALAWTWRGRLNRSVDALARPTDFGRRKARQFGVSVRQRGLLQTVRWGAYGFLKPNHLVAFVRHLEPGPPFEPGPSGARFQLWEARDLEAWRLQRRELPTEFFQDQIDGVDLCCVASVGNDLAGVIWIYRPGDPSRLFVLREGEAELNNCFVLEPFRRRGLFIGLKRYACHRLAERGYRRVYAMVHSENTPSLRANRRAGFEELGTVRHFLLARPRAAQPEESEAE